MPRNSTWASPPRAKIPKTNAKPRMFRKWIKINQFELLLFHVILSHAFEWRKQSQKLWGILRFKINKCSPADESFCHRRDLLLWRLFASRRRWRLILNEELGGCFCLWVQQNSFPFIRGTEMNLWVAGNRFTIEFNKKPKSSILLRRYLNAFNPSENNLNFQFMIFVDGAEVDLVENRTNIRSKRSTLTCTAALLNRIRTNSLEIS